MNQLWEYNGSDSIDEFVMEEIIVKNGLNPQKITEDIKVISEVGLLAMKAVTTNPNLIMNQFFAINNACFLYGVALHESLLKR